MVKTVTVRELRHIAALGVLAGARYRPTGGFSTPAALLLGALEGGNA